MPSHIHSQPFILHPAADLLERQPGLRQMAKQLADRYAEGYAISDRDLQPIGTALWQALLETQAGAADLQADLEADLQEAMRQAGAAILPVLLLSNVAAVQALPWESLYHPSLGFIGKHPGLTFSRQINDRPSSPERSETLDKGPLRVLLFTSLPDDVDAERGRLNLEEEQALVQEALLPWILKGKVDLHIPEDGRFASLQSLLKEIQPHLLFLSGHGSFQHAPHTGEAAYGAFFFEDEAGDSDGVTQDELASALIGSGVRAVVVSGCESAKNTLSSDALNQGLAQTLSIQGIPYVVGMRESIYDKAGIAFARALCDALGSGERIDYALQAARRAIPAAFQSQPQSQPQAQFQTPSTAKTRLAAEQGYGQWCLPMLFSANWRNALIDWDFPAKPVEKQRFGKTALGAVQVPTRFIGRRSAMRSYKNRLSKGVLRRLLITGPGGQGKTSLAGKLALDMQQLGKKVFAWRAQVENPWSDFVFEELQMALDTERNEKYERFCNKVIEQAKLAKQMFKLLSEQFQGQVVLLLDNLETLQNPGPHAHSHTLLDPTLAAWLDAATQAEDLSLIVTSRWHLPAWSGEHLNLERVNYGDFLQMAQGWQLPDTFFANRQLRHVYEVLAGNCRGLEFFAAAVRSMQDSEAKHEFLAKLAAVKTELQTNMAIAAIIEHLSAPALSLLQRLPVFDRAVPMEGLLRLGLDWDEPEALLEDLLAVSLIEASYEAHWQVWQYQCSPLVADWLKQRGQLDEAQEHLDTAADYQLYLFHQERHTLSQAIAAHQALRRAGRNQEADRLTLDEIVGPMTMAGFYASLLQDWLPGICEAQDAQTRAEALGQMGKLNHHIGEYETALRFLEQALPIQQQIGDKAGEGTTLNNLSGIYQAKGDYDTALAYLKQSLAICQQIGDKAGEGVSLSNLSGIYQAQGDYDTALAYLKQSLAIRQQIGDKAGEATTLNNLAPLHHAQGDYDTALAYLKQALAIRQQIGDKAGEGTTLNNLSQIYDAQGDYDTALAYLKQALVISQQIGDQAGLCASLFNMGHLYAQNQQVEEAVGAWVTVYTIAKAINLAQVLQALAKLAPQLGLPAGLAAWEELAQRFRAGQGE